MNSKRSLVSGMATVVLALVLVSCATTPTATVPPTTVSPTETTGATAIARPTETPAQAATSASATAPSTSGVDEAKQLVKNLMQPPQFQAPGPTMAIGDTMKGKKIYTIVDGINYQFVQNFLAGLTDAAKLVGMEVVAVDGAGDISKASTLIEQAIGQKANVIITEAFPAEQLSAAIKEAKSAGIPVIEVSAHDPQLPSSNLLDMGVKGIVAFCYSCAGKQMAQYAVAESNGHVNAVLFNVPEIGTAGVEKDGFVSELARLSPTSKVRVVDAPLAQWNDQLPTLTSSALQSDPTVNYLVPLYDSMVSLIKPQVHALGMESKVQIATYNGTLEGLQAIHNNDVVAADIGGMNHWLGWATMDQTLRVLSGSGAVADEKLPHRLFCKEDISEVDLNKDETSWYGNIDLQAEYSKLWGMK